VHSPGRYFNLMQPLVSEIDLWTTEYIQQLPAKAHTYTDTHDASTLPRHPVLEFTKSTGLMPILEALGGEKHADCQTYLAEYDRLLHEYYPIIEGKHDGYLTLMPFKRLFMVCKM
jgi:trans-aconitate methyltransferase